ncbi:MAG: YkgJ family cysteine cluster protein [Bacillota bacterium]
MSDGSVKFIPVDLKDGLGYDLTISDAGATVQDYLDAINEALECLPLSRLWHREGTCPGCDLCCRDRIPLTSIDLVRLLEATSGRNKGVIPWHCGLRDLAFISIKGRAVDITLRIGDDRRCHLMDPDTGMCRIYSWRPLVCQTFSCAPLTTRAARLRETLVNTGEDELVRQWLLDAQKRGVEPIFNEAHKPQVRMEDWETNGFGTYAAYDQVRIKDLCSPSLWKALTGS